MTGKPGRAARHRFPDASQDPWRLSNQISLPPWLPVCVGNAGGDISLLRRPLRRQGSMAHNLDQTRGACRPWIPACAGIGGIFGYHSLIPAQAGISCGRSRNRRGGPGSSPGRSEKRCGTRVPALLIQVRINGGVMSAIRLFAVTPSLILSRSFPRSLFRL